jgi:SNF2 family DNA or RNA helicase
MSRIRVEQQSDLIRLDGWVGPGTPAKCKAVGGGKFVPKDKGGPYWTFPRTLPVCRAIRAQFGDALDIGPALNRWARQAIEAETILGTLSLAETAVLSRVPALAPKMDAAMHSRSYQRVAAAWGAATGSFLLADQQGLGKSIETLATIIETAPEVGRTQWHLITSPSVAVDSVWAPEVRRWLADADVAVLPLTGSLAERQETLSSALVLGDGVHSHVFVVVNIESARIKPSYDEERDPGHRKPKYLTKDAVLPALHSIIWDTVVVDECQRALIRTSGKPTQARAGFSVLSRNSHRRIALSGTPMRGKPEQLWGTLNWLRPDVYTSYWNWIKRYFNLTSNGFSNYILNGFQPGGEDRLAADLKSIMLRRTKAEVLPELPAKQYAGTLADPTDEQSPLGVWLDAHPKQAKQIADLERDGLLEFGDEELMVNGTLAAYTRQKQLANAVHELRGGVLLPTLESPKYEWLLNWLAEADGEKVVVASQFTAIIDCFAKGLAEAGYAVAVLTGNTPKGKRAKMVEDFQTTDKVQVFMLNTKAGGVALTLDAADYMVLLDETTVPDDQEQVEDRIHRTSRIHNVTVYYLRTLGTLDEEVAWIAAARMDVQQYLLDGARGVSTARALYTAHTKEK